MKFPDAVRLGSMLHEQCHGELFAYDGNGNLFASCAVGAALEAIGQTRNACLYWPELMEPSHCPACNEPAYINNVITHLNDSHLWTREAIADWLDTILYKEEKVQHEEARV